MRNRGSENESVAPVIDAAYWGRPPQCLSLGRGQVHVWLAELNVPAERVEYSRTLLSADEHARAERFHFDRDRNAYIMARGLTRTLLARYLDCRPRDIEFAYGSRGKPTLGGQFEEHPLHFNLSHSGALALCAFVLGHDVGVDIERMREDFAGEKIARRFFSPAEVAALLALPNETRVQAFFECWTRKEAFIKAIGEGLSFPLDQFDVSLGPDRLAALLATRPDALEVTQWSLHDVKTPPGYAGAVAVKCPGAALTCWLWQETARSV